MRKKEIRQRLNMAISSSVPDVLEDILNKCEEKEGFKMKKSIEIKEKKKLYFNPKLIGAFATVIILVVSILGIRHYNVMKVDSIIEFDVNPSIKMEVNKDEEVIDVIGLNKDGKKVIDDMDFDNVDLDIAVNAIIGSMLKNGYISVSENSILVSVKNDDIKKSNKLQKQISKDIESLLGASSIEAAILTQSYDEDKDTIKQANENNISEGKTKLINNILQTGITDTAGNPYTFELLSTLSINELNLLLNNKQTEVKNVSSTGTASDASYIGKDKAKEIAFGHANTSENKTRELEIELDADNGKLIYEVEFKVENKEYDYDIDARTGEIIKNHVEIDDDYQKTTSNNKQNSTKSNNKNKYDDDYYDDDDDYDDDYDD